MTSRFCTLTPNFFSLEIMTACKFRSIENPGRKYPQYLRGQIILVGGEGNDDITHNIVSVDCWY